MTTLWEKTFCGKTLQKLSQIIIFFREAIIAQSSSCVYS